MRKPDLEGVKPGDKLICQRNIGGGAVVYTVERLTKTLAVCGSVAFALSNGKMRGTDGWNSRWARIPTADDLARIELDNRKARAKRALENIVVTDENLEAAEAFIATSQKKKDGA